MKKYYTELPKRYLETKFYNFQNTTPEHKRLKSDFLAFAENPDGINRLVHGSVGTGKTHSAYAFMHEISDVSKQHGNDGLCFKSEKAALMNMKDLIDGIKASFNGGDDYVKQKAKKVPVLLLDEVGLQYGTDSERIELFEIFNHRYNNCLPTICFSNLPREKFEPILGKRICDRLFSGAEIYELKGPSMRGERRE